MSRASQLGRTIGAALGGALAGRVRHALTQPTVTPIAPIAPIAPLAFPRPTRAVHPASTPPLLDRSANERRDPDAGVPVTSGIATPATPATAASVDRVGAFMDLFCHYRGDHARQYRAVDKETGELSYGWARVGKRAPDDCALTGAVVEAHLRGQVTAGTYLLDEEDRCRLLVLDHDDKRTLPELDPATGRRRVIEEDGLAMLQDCRRRLDDQGIACAVAESRRGGHLFIFLDEPTPARDARALAMLALGTDEVERMHRGHEAFEIYPKQDQRGGRGGRDGSAGSTGSNIALPLGVHLKDGERHPFVDRHGDTVAPTLSGQIDYATTIERCRVRAVLHARPWLYGELDRATHPVRTRTPERAPERTPERAPERALERAPEPGARQIERMGGPRREMTPNGQGQPSLIARWKGAYPLIPTGRHARAVRPSRAPERLLPVPHRGAPHRRPRQHAEPVGQPGDGRGRVVLPHGRRRR